MPTVERTLALDMPRNLVFGAGCAGDCVRWITDRRYASVFLVTSPPTAALCAPIAAQLTAAGCRVTPWSGIAREPADADVESALVAAREAKADVVVGLGGGSVMDVA